jgi:hypothetical protein
MMQQPTDFTERCARQGETELLAAVSDDFRDELRRLLGGGALGSHADVLLQSTRDGKPDIDRLFRYGMENLPSGEKRPDDALAAFFIALSELDVCSTDLRIFATKCMEYCESDALDGWSEPLSTLRKSFESLADQLRRSGRP